MSEVEQQPDTTPGTIPWNELITNDQAASIEFYSGLFGWSTDQMEMPDGNSYTLFKQGDKMVAGCVQPPAEAGAKPMWLSYVNVEDLDATISKAQELGANLLSGRVDLPMGSFAIIADPQGAVIAFWQGSGEEECDS